MATGKLHWDERERRGQCATHPARVVADYFEEVRGFLAKKHKPKELHRMRLASKRLRYTLELFRGCYGPGLEQRLDALKDVQDALGDVNDAVAAEGLLDPRTVQKVRRFLRARAEEKARSSVCIGRRHSMRRSGRSGGPATCGKTRDRRGRRLRHFRPDHFPVAQPVSINVDLRGRGELEPEGTVARLSGVACAAAAT